MCLTSDTIVALASARQGGTRGVVRISGPQALGSVARWVRIPLPSLGAPQAIESELLLAPQTGADRWLPVTLLVWPGIRSYTRQPMVEIHSVGSLPLLDILVRQLSQPPCRLAQPGEFTLRAFLAGRIDLTQAEAVLGVIDARGPGELDVALTQLAGGMSRPLSSLREEMLMLVAELEAGLDFAEEDIEFIAAEVATQRIAEMAERIRQLARQLGARRTTGELPRVVLAGPPNAGKSSLFNALVERYADSQNSLVQAIVSPQPGATRDYISATLSIAGTQLQLVDTAGEAELPQTDVLGGAAQHMTRAARQQADLLLVCSDQASALLDPGPHMIHVGTKGDLEVSHSSDAIVTSAAQGVGLDELAAEIARRLAKVVERSEMVPATAERCAVSLQQALEAAEAALELTRDPAAHDLAVHELRHALNALGEVAGEVATDDILDRVFRQFCIGK